MAATTVDGTCDPAFVRVRDVLAAQLADGRQIGAAVAVRVNDREVVDLWGGHADSDRSRPWAPDTVVNVWSTTKGVVALAFHMLVDRGLLDPDRPVRMYWPEFTNDAVLVRHLLSHRAGLAAFREPTTADELADWKLMITRLADTQPWWEPGTASGYHALTYGFLVGELIRRVTGGTVREFLHREVADRAGADFRIGLSPADNHRVATLVQPPPPDPAAFQAMFAQLNPVALAVLTNPIVGPAEGNAEFWRAAEIPAANGHGTARGVAALYGAFAFGGVAGGQRLLSAGQAERAREGQGASVDLVIGAAGLGGRESELALGLWLSGPDGHYGPNPRAVGHDGFGGSFGLADPEAGLAIGHTMNLMGNVIADDPRKMELIEAVYSCL
ncbi:serine hydrolase domain-containing protein [Kutzneria chonburiensis]|uniref:Serine hydrolase domain-containing protein n=1 Tax=Kutzneria chonburiensis TaxID=1483604 RepID=A0ABV6N1W0_9PSEU|nr:serine hydrolase domain-containing protein [Kutzneria chonburiensis]